MSATTRARATPSHPSQARSAPIRSVPEHDMVPSTQRSSQTTPNPEKRRLAVRPEYTHEREMQMQKASKDVEIEQFNDFVEYLERFAKRPEAFSRQADDMKDAMLLVTRNEATITELRQQVLLFGGKGALVHTDPELLGRVITILLQRIYDTSELCTFAAQGNIRQAGSSPVVNAKLGMLCCAAVLAILSAPGCPRKLLVEELLDEIFTLVRSCASFIIFPLCDPLYKAAKVSRKKRDRRKSRHGTTANHEGGDDSNDEDVEMAPKRPSSGKRGLSKRDDALIDAFCLTLDALTAIFQKEQFLPESTISHVASLCVQSLSVTGIVRLQSHAMKTACMIFRSYPMQRISMLDELREVISIIPAARRHLRCYQLPEGQSSVRASTALLAQLLCVICQDSDSEVKPTANNPTSEDITDSWTSIRRRNHERSVKLAVHVLDPLLKRVHSDREIEFRTAFQAFFEDLLILYGHPEWPSAELMLQTLSVSVITRLRAQEKSAHSRGIAIDTLGALAGKMCTLYGSDLFKDSGGNASTFSLNEGDLEKERENLLLYLDPDRSLHFAAANAFYEALYVADDHSFALNIEKRAKTMAKERDRLDQDDDEEIIDGEDQSLDGKIIQSVDENALKRTKSVAERRLRCEEVRKSDALAAARLVGRQRSFTAGFRTILEGILDGMHDPAPTIRAKSIKALSAVDESCQGLLRVLPSVLKYIEASCRDVSTLARDAALDLLSRSLMNTDGNGSQHTRISEETTSGPPEVHEDAALVFKIFGIVEKRLCDTATSVRKRAINIMRAVLSNALEATEQLRGKPMDAMGSLRAMQKEEAKIIQICASLVSRLDDPETTVREAAERTLRLGVFGFDISQHMYKSDGQEGERASQLASRLITVFARLPANIHSSFVYRVVHKAILIKCKPLLEAIVSSTVEQMREHESNMAAVIGGKHHKSMSEAELKKLRVLSTRRVACSSVICAFGGLDSSLVIPHCRALAPSIKGVQEIGISESDLICIQRILQVLEIGFRSSENHEQSFLEEVLRDVELIVCTSPIYMLEEASVKCLCVVSERLYGMEYNPLEQAAENFLSFLADQLESLEEYCGDVMPEKPTALERNARGALVRLGLLIRYGDFKTEFVETVYDTLESISKAVNGKGRRDTLARACVRAMSHVLIRHRSFLTRGTTVFLQMLERAENSGSPSDIRHTRQSAGEGVHLSVLQSFHELLRDEEERNSGTDKDERTEGGRSDRGGTGNKGNSNMGDAKGGDSGKVDERPALAAEEDAEAGFLALSAQAMIPSIKRAVYNGATSVRRTAANILGLLVRQGLVLPGIVVGELFGLLLDRDIRCREYSYRVIAFLADRHSNMLASGAILALRVCFWRSFLVHSSPQAYIGNGDKTEGFDVPNLEKMRWMVTDGKTGHSLLSQALMAMRRDERRGVLESMMREFDPRAVLRVESAENRPPDTSVEVEVEKGGSKSAVVDDSMEVQVMEIEKRDDDSEEDDDLAGGKTSGIMDISCAATTCSVPTLYFLAMTIACVDYTNGAGIGGSLSQGGGTAAAETKMKYAKEDVVGLIGIATRIISNSGQSILRVAKQLLRGKKSNAKKKMRIATYAARMGVLLELKQHLKIERWKALLSTEEAKEKSESSGVGCRMGWFNADETGLRYSSWNIQDFLRMDEESADGILKVFCKLMREDAIDETEVVASSTRRGGRSGKRRASNAKKSGAKMRIEEGNYRMANVRRSKLQRRVSTTKRLSYDMESDEGGSDFDPRGHK